MRLMIVGDTHGGNNGGQGFVKGRFVEYKAKICKDLGIDRMIIVGDFGMWPGHGGILFLDDLEEIARKYDIKIYALRGNHDDTVQWNYYIENAPKDASGFSYVRSRVLIAPTIHFWKWDNKRFGICGGAVSVDKAGRTIGESWWPDEAFSEENLKSVLRYKGNNLDYLFTHDASDHTEWGYHLIPDLDSKACRQRIDKVIAHLKPEFHFHGHMHAKYWWVNRASHGRHYSAFGIDDSEYNGHCTETFGLECNSDEASWCVLDTEDNKAYWPNRAYDRYLDGE
jgi:Icc-related predicted phosphoesterase